MSNCGLLSVNSSPLQVWNNSNITDWLMVLITFVYVIATIIMCYFNWKSVKTTQEALKETKREFRKNLSINKSLTQREQAVCIACWATSEECDLSLFEREDCEPVVIHIVNNSKEPIYDVVVSYDMLYSDKEDNMLTGTDNCSYLQSVPPGDYLTIVPWGGPGMHMRFEPSISFRDSRGVYWHRNANGILKRLKNTSIEFRKLSQPVEFGLFYNVSK